MTSNALKIEQHGVDAVPPAERTKRWWDLFVIHAGINITLPSFLIGALLVPGLSWSQACWALVIGNLLLGILVSLAGYVGVDFGIPTSVASRFSLGYPKGMWLSSLCILLSLTGWFAITAELAGLAVDGLVQTATGFSAPTVMIVLVGVSNAVPAIIGFESIKWLSRLAVPLLLGLAVWLLVVIGEQHALVELVRYQPTGEVSFTTALDWVIGGLIAGVFVASDISRYVRSRADNWMGAILGILPTAAFLGALGILAKLATGNWNPVHSVQALGLGIPALLIIVFATWTTNDANLYSAGLALTNIVPRLGRWQNTLLVSLAGTVLAALRITEHFDKFLQGLAYAFSPLVGVVLVDYFFIRRARLKLEEAYKEKGRFYYARGVNLVAWVTIGIGFLIGIYAPPHLLASLTVILVTGLIYYAAMKVFHRSHFTREMG